MRGLPYRGLASSGEKLCLDLENNLEETTEIVTFNKNNIQILENVNTDLKINLDETTEKFNDVRNKLSNY